MSKKTDLRMSVKQLLQALLCESYVCTSFIVLVPLLVVLRESLGFPVRALEVPVQT